MKNRAIWFDARNLKNKKVTLPLVYSLHFEYMLVGEDSYKTMKAPHKIKFIVWVKPDSTMEFPKGTVIMSDSIEVLMQASQKGFTTALYKYVGNRGAMEAAWKEGGEFEYLVVEFADETNIPLELLLARLQTTKTSILKIVDKTKEGEIAMQVMEVGSNGFVLTTEDINEILEADALMVKEGLGKLQLVKGKVVDVQHIGMGFRSCIDTTNILGKNEGMIIGSTSSGGLLVSSETHFLPYMELRPFRVNAGAVHSYVWTPDGNTSYMTELKGGSRVLCVDTEGNTREASVGRVKTEIRPLLKIEVEASNVRVNAIVQDDWHIRIFGGNGEVRNASTIKIGDELLAYICEGGRHVGIKIDEKLEEV